MPPSIRLLLLIASCAPLTGDVGSCWLGSSATSSNLRLSRPLLPKKPSKDCCVCGVLLPPGDAINDDEQKMRLQFWRSARLKFRWCSFAPKAKEFLEFNLNFLRLCPSNSGTTLEHSGVVGGGTTYVVHSLSCHHSFGCDLPTRLVMLWLNVGLLSWGNGVRYKFCSGSKRLRRRWCRCSC